MDCHFILYVRDQEASTRFYEQVLDQVPTLNVSGMTEFRVADACVLGLMPEKGIQMLLGNTIEDLEASSGIARAELYLRVNRPLDYLKRADAAGARMLSPFAPRDWGDQAGYVADLDGHVLAFACSA